MRKYRAPRKTTGPNRENVTEDLRKMIDEELHEEYTTPIVIPVIKEGEMGGECGMNVGEKVIQGVSGVTRRKETIGMMCA
jgi:hypothetical protein